MRGSAWPTVRARRRLDCVAMHSGDGGGRDVAAQAAVQPAVRASFVLLSGVDRSGVCVFPAHVRARGDQRWIPHLTRHAGGSAVGPVHRHCLGDLRNGGHRAGIGHAAPASRTADSGRRYLVSRRRDVLGVAGRGTRGGCCDSGDVADRGPSPIGRCCTTSPACDSVSRSNLEPPVQAARRHGWVQRASRVICLPVPRAGRRPPAVLGQITVARCAAPEGLGRATSAATSSICPRYA